MQNKGQLTLIIVRRTLTEPKTALAGVTAANSLARFRASMAMINVAGALSRRLDCCDPIVVRKECGLRRRKVGSTLYNLSG